MQEKKVKEIEESSSIQQKLIYKIQELEKEEGFKEIDSEKAIINLALINFLFEFKLNGNPEGLFSSLEDELVNFHEEAFPTVESEVEFIKSEKAKHERAKKRAELELRLAEDKLKKLEAN